MRGALVARGTADSNLTGSSEIPCLLGERRSKKIQEKDQLRRIESIIKTPSVIRKGQEIKTGNAQGISGRKLLRPEELLPGWGKGGGPINETGIEL